VMKRAERAWERKEVVGVPVGAPYPDGWLDQLFDSAAGRGVAVLPVAVDAQPSRRPKVLLTFGRTLPWRASAEEARRAIDGWHEPPAEKPKAKAAVTTSPFGAKSEPQV